MSFGFRGNGIPIFSAGLEVISCSKPSKSILPFCAYPLNVFIFVEILYLSDIRRVIFNFETHIKNLNY